ncbi:hypothetical protein G432_01115 [Sphingomonas sp. MM-1]|uniref:hypothetical protein n=1 Tax=Sphingomonas sp. MM-1 TaxID=745310 RepID=UPI0002C04A07|nr:MULTISPECIES: hypothetical protein [unclassified Sphingomonas]AGH47951.1 hypothetical protein G432_01115 [Sphingomonas sp. MM-1]MDX3882797.1 hypothetical protein [Sphingomonas sp.]
MHLRIPIAALLAFAGGAAVAQTAPAPQTAVENAADAQEVPVTRGLNAREGSEASAQQAASEAVQAQYEADMAAYRTSVQAHAQAVAQDEARFARQQRAYADAMAAWREQKRDCDRGVLKACKKPTPNPSDFY